MSSYRDDREALHHRVAQLEQQLDDARRQGQEEGRDAAEDRAAALEQRLTAMRGELANMESELAALRGKRPAGPPKTVVVAAVAGVALVGVGMAVLLAMRPAKRSPPVVVQVPVPPPAPVPMPEPPAPPSTVAPAKPLPEPPAPAPRSVTAKWTATVTRVDGLSLAAGASCTLEATITTPATNTRVDELVITCGGQKLYRKSDPFSGMAQMDNDARELLGPTDEKGTYTLQYRDVGSRTGERSQVDLDTTRSIGHVFRDTIPRFRVDLAMAAASLPGPTLEKHLRRTGTVGEVTGPAPVKVGATCVLRAMATGQGERCVAEVRCGATMLVPKTTDLKCGYDRGRPVTLSGEDGAPGVALVDASLTVTGKGFTAVIGLDPLSKDD